MIFFEQFKTSACVAKDVSNLMRETLVSKRQLDLFDLHAMNEYLITNYKNTRLFNSHTSTTLIQVLWLILSTQETSYQIAPLDLAVAVYMQIEWLNQCPYKEEERIKNFLSY